jgi:hypothetical protein
MRLLFLKRNKIFAHILQHFDMGRYLEKGNLSVIHD